MCCVACVLCCAWRVVVCDSCVVWVVCVVGVVGGGCVVCSMRVVHVVCGV